MDGGNPDSIRTETDGRDGGEGVAAAAGREVKVSLFDSSVESHVRTMEAIAKICGREEPDVSLEDREVVRLSSAITFLREWRYFKYEPKVIKFVDSSKSYEKTSPAIEVTLPQFSAAAVPKDISVFDEAAFADSSKDYVIHVGGPIWSLDWCPRDSGGPECQFKEEFIAVSAHPSGSSYHKLGSPLTGRGAIQIWCLVTVKEGEIASVDDRRQKRQNSQALKGTSTKPKRPRGRPRKKPVEKSLDSLNTVGEFVEGLDIQLPQDTTQSASPNWTSDDAMPIAALRDLCRKKRKSKRLKGNNVKLLETCIGRSCDSEPQEERSLSVRTDDDGLSIPNQQKHCSVFTQQPEAMNDADESLPLCIGSDHELPMDVAIPRLVFCLAHNGKVARDTKWRPASMNLKQCQHRMGYLAVLLGNGSLEVWEVPLPQTVRAIYSSVHMEGTDPRFLKLEPVFRCGMIRSGGMQSLPLAVEWSVSDSQEYLLAGCHDGTVALWKFSVNDQLKDTKPLLCFTADKFPIRAVAWAPHESDPEAANVIVTAGHGGIKFWDIRDPFRPLWDLHSFPHHILGLDWVPDPRCITFAFDDGTLKFISLSKAASDTPVTGKPFGVTKGFLHSYSCSSFAMWSLHVSRHTGIVAYCTADGNVLCFQLTTKAVEKESLRYRTPHFMCVSVVEEKPAIVLNMSASDAPITRKKSLHSEDTAIGIYDDQREEKRWTPDSEDRPLALCYGNDPSRDSELEENLPSSKKKKKKKSLAKSKAPDERIREADLALVCSDQEPENKVPEEENKGDPGLPFGTLPPKIVAMHRVRWNVNKDGAKWLCSGGAAGIVRCQEITTPIVHKK